MNRKTTTLRRGFPWGAALFSGALLLAHSGRAQLLLDEHFTGGASTTGFTVTQDGGDCEWTYAPGGVTATSFNQDFGGSIPSGGGFDSDFAFIDSDDCNGVSTTTTVNTFLTSAPFDASAPGIYVLSFAHQFQYRGESFARVEVFNGDDWVQVANWTGESIGYPNPAAVTTLDITDALAGNANAQVRFHFNSAWDWWWALDNVSVTLAQCAFPQNLAVTDLTTEGATFTWDDNGAPGYEWVVTTGAVPDGTNGLASGDGTNTTATGLLGGTGYSVFVRALCDGEGTSAWSDGVPFVTSITNDEPTDAMALTVNPDLDCGTITHGTVFGATDSGLNECNGTPDDDVWFSFTAINTAHIISLINVSGSTGDMMIAVWTGDPSAPTLVAGSCSDPEMELVSGLTPGEVYYVQVYTYTSTAGQNSQFDVCIGTLPPPPANDEPCGAVPVTVNADLSCSATTHGSVASATGSGLETPCYGTADDDVWFSFVAANSTHYISLENISGSTADMYMAVWSGDCDGGLTIQPFSCSDPDLMSVSGLAVGETYYVQVYTYTSTPAQTSSFDLCVGTPTEPPPANDEPCDATALTMNPDAECGTTTPGTVLGATGSNLATTCYGTPDDDVWFSFTATNTTHIFSLLNVSGSNTDMYHALWSGDCDDLTLVENSCNDGDASMFSGLTIGQTYYVQVYTYTSEPGQDTQFDACIGTPGAPPANDECSGALPVTVNFDEECTNVTPGTINGATGSGPECGGTADDDVWFSFVAEATIHTISLNDIEGSTTDLYLALWSGDCGDLDLVSGSCSDFEEVEVSGLTVGNTYYIQAYSWTSTPLQNSTFNVCVSSDPDDFPLDCEGVPGGDAVPGSPCINEEFNVGGTWTANCLCQPNVGIAEISAPALITLAPNPASTELYLTVSDARTVSVRIYDMLGHLVMQRPMAKHLSIAQLAPGAYSLVAVDAQAQPVGRARFVKR